MKRSVRENALAPLRVLLPTWRFFDEIGFALQLSARIGRAPGALGAWLPLLPPKPTPRRRAWHLLLDAPGNLQLAQRGVLERLLGDLAALGDGDDPRQLVTYAQVLALVRSALAGAPRDAQLVQFRLTQATDDGPHEELLCSAVHSLRAA